MTIELKNLSELDQSVVDEAYALIVQLVQDYNPSIDVKRGVIADIVLHLSAVLTSANQDMVDQVRRSNSLKAINDDPTLADDETVDLVASNYLTARKLGTTASGPIVLITDTLATIVVPEGAIFTTDAGITFTTDATYIARISEDDVLVSTDKLLRSMGDGTYSFAVSVTATDVGSVGNVPLGQRFIAPPINNAITTSYAGTDFTGGSDDESNATLMARLASSMASKTLANRTSIEGLIRAADLDEFDDGLATSSVGYGDVEQIRYHSILPIAFGGRVDTYLRPCKALQSTQLLKTATLISVAGITTSTWQLSFDRDEVPALYEVTRIALAVDINDEAATSFTVTSDARNMDISDGTTAGLLFFPDVTTVLETTYTRYQTATIRFTDTITTTTGLAAGVTTATYGVVVTAVPDIAEIQDVVSARDVRYPIGDCLVKAPMPCFTSVTINIGMRNSDTAPDATAIQEKIAEIVNLTGFTNRLPVSIIIVGIQSLLSGTVAVTSITLQGILRKPNGATSNFASTSVLDLGSDTTNMCTSRTIAFFLNPEDVTVNISLVDALSA